MIDGISEYRAWRPEKGEKFRAFCKRGRGEFFAGQFGPLICTRVKEHSSARVAAAPSKGVSREHIGREMFVLDSVRWRFVAESRLSPGADTE